MVRKSGIYLGLLLLVFAGSVIQAQEMEFNPADSAFARKFESFDMKGAFTALAFTDSRTNYFLADFTRLPGRFEKIWFLQQIFKDNAIVNADTDIENDRIWFRAAKTFPVKDVLLRMDRYLDQTIKESAMMTTSGKEAWLEKNDKYKQGR